MDGANLLLTASWDERRHVRFDDLAVGEYNVRFFEIVNTAYGPTLKAEIEGDKYLLLPRRFVTGQTDEKIAAVNSMKWKLEYRGKDLTQRGL